MGCCLNLRKHPGYTQLKGDVFQFSVAWLSSINYFCYKKGRNLKFFFSGSRKTQGKLSKMSVTLCYRCYNGSKRGLTSVGFSQGSPSLGFSADFRAHTSIRVIASSTRASWSASCLKGRESVWRQVSTWASPESWLLGRSWEEVNYRLGLKALLTYAKSVKDFRFVILLLVYCTHMGSGTGFDVTTHLNKDLQKIDSSCVYNLLLAFC